MAKSAILKWSAWRGMKSGSLSSLGGQALGLVGSTRAPVNGGREGSLLHAAHFKIPGRADPLLSACLPKHKDYQGALAVQCLGLGAFTDGAQLQSLVAELAPHERLPEILVVPREKIQTGLRNTAAVGIGGLGRGLWRR